MRIKKSQDTLSDESRKERNLPAAKGRSGIRGGGVSLRLKENERKNQRGKFGLPEGKLGDGERMEMKCSAKLRRVPKPDCRDDKEKRESLAKEKGGPERIEPDQSRGRRRG